MKTDIKKLQKETEKLREEIRHHNTKYYDDDDPEISDAEFDLLMERLKKIEAEHPELVTPDSPTQIIGGHATFGKKVKHDIPLQSLDDVFDENDVKKFIENIFPA